MSKIKVAIVNHFSTAEVRSHLDLHSPGRQYAYRDYGLWNVNIINGLKNCDDIELHVITPHIGMKRKTQVFNMGDVNYYFYNPDFQYPWAYFDHSFFSQKRRGYPRNRKIINGFINEIQPDIVNLIGAENPYYAMSVLDMMNVPILIHLQTVYANPDRKKNTGNVDQERWDRELMVFHKTPYKACTGRMYYDLVKGYEPHSIIFPRRWPASKFPDVPDVEKKYDFVFFARELCKNKGFDNAIEAIARFAELYPKTRFLAIGKRDGDWPLFEARINELGLEKNLEIHGSFEKYIDMLQYVRQARFALLPIKMDVLSGTILEAMRMDMPIVTSRTSGTPSLNEKRETVLISDIGDIDGLLQNMRMLYEDVSLQEKLTNNSRIYLQEIDEENAHNVEEMVNQFKAVIAHYRYGKPVPQELLYNIDINTDYRKA